MTIHSSRGFCAAILTITLLWAGAAFGAVPAPYPSQILSAGTLPSGFQMASADLNGDGLPDIVVADDFTSSTSPPSGGVWVYLAQKGGGYAAPVFYATPCYPWVLALGDLGNGHVDIVVGNDCVNTGNEVSVLIGNGDGTFKSAVNYSPDTTASVSPDSITIGDATGDGKPDVVIGNGSTNAAYVIPGNGDGTLNTSAVQKLTLSNNSSYGVLVTDLNNDGHPDILVADSCNGSPGAVDVFLGTASGTFSSTPSQSVTVGGCPEFGVDNDAQIGSTDPDIAVANYNDGTYQVLSNSGGTLTAGAPVSLPSGACPYWIHVTDVDGDGNPDLVMSDPCNDTLDIAYGKSGGGFDAPVYVPVGYDTFDVTAIPVTVGQDLVALANKTVTSSGLVVARNLGSRDFYAHQDFAYQNSSAQGQYASDMAMADFNNDGKPDAVVANSGDNTLSVLLNNGDGTFKAPTVITTGATGIDAVAGTYLNGNSSFVTADNSGHLYTYLGKGDGTFQAPITSTIASSTVYGIDVEDVNGDGLPDAIVSEHTANQVQVCKGDGAGNFNCGAFPAISVPSPNRVLIADVNGDKKQDLIVTTSSPDATVSGATDAYVYLGNGDGTFSSTPTATLPVMGNAWGIAFDDFNGDGNLDLVFGSTSGNLISVFTGKGNGTFNPGVTYASAGSPSSVAALVDVNGDGYDDIIAGNGGNSDSTFSVFTNKGDGTFNKAVSYSTGYEVSALRAIDLNGSGLPDVVTANYGGGTLASSTISVFMHDPVPVVTGTSLTVNENSSGTGTVTGTDAVQNPLTYAVASQPSHGSVSLNATTGSFTYTPASNYSGSDSFTVTASDGLETSAPATVSITVKATSSGSGGGGGGGFGLLSLLALSGLALRRRRR